MWDRNPRLGLKFSTTVKRQRHIQEQCHVASFRVRGRARAFWRISEDDSRAGYREPWQLTLNTIKGEGCGIQMQCMGLWSFPSCNLSCPIDELVFAFFYYYYYFYFLKTPRCQSLYWLFGYFHFSIMCLVSLFSTCNKKTWLIFDFLVSSLFAFLSSSLFSFCPSFQRMINL